MPKQSLDSVGKYTIIEEIGQGGMSVVYRGRDSRLERDVAIKVLHPHLARDPDSRERFAREARAVARLAHRNIPEVHDFSSTEDDFTYLVSELIEGGPLASHIREGIWLPEVGMMMALGVADALMHAHEHNVIHRDVKPENILVGTDGVVKLTDFGIAHIIGLESMTITGTLVGSPAHMAPEQIEGLKDLDERVDVWALGTVLYVLSTKGALPFDASTPHGVLKRILDGKYEDPRRLNPHVDGHLRSIIARCLTVDRTERFQTVSAVRNELVEWLQARGIEDCEGGIREWMDDAVGFERRFCDQLVQRLHHSAKMWVAEGDAHSALGAYGRILLLRDDDLQALEGIRRLNRGFQIRRLVRVAGGAILAGVVIGVLVVAGVALFSQEQATTAVVGSAQPVAVEGGSDTASSLMPSDIGSSEETSILLDRAKRPDVVSSREPIRLGAKPGRRVGASLAEWSSTAKLMMRKHLAQAERKEARFRAVEQRPVSVRLSAYPLPVKIVINGRAYGNPSTAKLRPGTYSVTLEHPSCGSCAPVKERLVVRPSLTGKDKRNFIFRYKPSQLRVSCPGGKVFVNKKLKGKCNQFIKVQSFNHKPTAREVMVRLDDGRTRVWKNRLFRPGGRIQLSFR